MKADKALPLCCECIEPCPVQISRLSKEGEGRRKRQRAGRQERTGQGEERREDIGRERE